MLISPASNSIFRDLSNHHSDTADLIKVKSCRKLRLRNLRIVVYTGIAKAALYLESPLRPRRLNLVLALGFLIPTMQRPRRARRAIVFHDDRLANEEDLVKKKRLETSNLGLSTSIITGRMGLTLQINYGRLLLVTSLEIASGGSPYSIGYWILARQMPI
jgi:hypothetical protein